MVEYLLLRHSLGIRIGQTRLPRSFIIKIFGAAGAAAIFGLIAAEGLRRFAMLEPIFGAVLVLGVYGLGYLCLTQLLGIAEARAAWNRIRSGFMRLKPR